MPVLTDIEIKLDAREVVLALHQGKKAPEAMIEETWDAIGQSQALIHPRALYRWVKVLGVNGEQVLLAPGNGGGDAVLRLGPHADLMAKAELALVSIVTIGGKLDHHINELNKSGKLLEAYLLDSVGVVALAEVGKAIRKYVEMEAESRGWGVSASLAPGSLQGWPIEGQFALCGLLPLDDIGVHLNESGVLVPFKSVSSLIGMGGEYQSKKVGSVCRFCMRAETCWRRRE
ncbi:MAG: hypothetical protein JRI80_07855 [Deltaproteobacteria bacterium]|nr:hypothetical protein [Deltaproteobacteria bacterium]